MQLEDRFTKDEILTAYLNTVFYGNNAYGIEAAAQTYFAKPAKELTLAQARETSTEPARNHLLRQAETGLQRAASQLQAQRCGLPEAVALLEGLGLAAGDPPRRLAQPDPVETVLTLEHEDVRELERLRAAIEPGAPATPVDALPDLGAQFGGAKVGRNDPCPCGSGRKFKKCHGA